MRLFLLLIAFVGLPPTIRSGIVSFGIIRNVSLKILQSNSITINGTCQTCLCALSFNTSLFAFNCFGSNLTCEMYSNVDQNKAFSLMNSVASAFYFFSLPTYQDSRSTLSSSVEQSSMWTSEDCIVLSLASNLSHSVSYVFSHIKPVDFTRISVDIRFDLPRPIRHIHWHTHE